MVLSCMPWRKYYRRMAAGVGIPVAMVLLSAAAGDGCQSTTGRIGSNTCLACHDGRSGPDKREFRQGLHRNMACEDCHGPGAQHFDVGGRNGLFIDNPGRAPYTDTVETCAKCHPEEAAGYQGTEHFKDKAASCNTCHDIHKTGAMIISTANSAFLESSEYAQICGRCHSADVDGFLDSAHALSDVATCGACHNLHTGDTFTQSPEDNSICLQCHASFELGFDVDGAVDYHTGEFHPDDPAGSGASRCIACHMPPLRAQNQTSGNHSHSLWPRPPADTADQILVGETPTPNSCAGIMGCHDAQTPGSGTPYDLNSLDDNDLLQTFYEQIGGLP